MRIHKYDTDVYDFRNHFHNLWGVGENLEDLHFKYKSPNIFDMTNNSDTPLHDKFYDTLKEDIGQGFLKKYDDFVAQYIPDIIGEEFVYQAKPTLRIHFVNNWATPEFHVDTQEGYNHPDGEYNFIMPMTRCYDTNAVWVESQPNKKDFTPITMEYGDLFQFSGGTLNHGNKINKTATTRVSIDFRVLPMSKYNPEYPKTSNTKGTRFVVGGYYKEVE